MRTQRLTLSVLKTIRHDPWEETEENPLDMEQAIQILRKAVEQELTTRQRECMGLYYFKRLTMEQIAQALGINKSTVCRHLQKALRRLEKAFSYTTF